jgi:hypothetical protein
MKAARGAEGGKKLQEIAIPVYYFTTTLSSLVLTYFLNKFIG